jgi:DedD protein
MEQGLKERLVGAAVLVIMAVIFIPMLLGGSPESDEPITETNIPQRPDDKSSSRIVPLLETNTEKGSTIEVIKEDEIKPVDKLEESESSITRQETIAEPGQAVKLADKSQSKRVGLTAWVVQLGSFNDKENADLLNEKLRKAGYPAFVEPLKQGGGTIYRVRVGPEILRSDADSLLDKLKTSMKLDGIVLRYP